MALRKETKRELMWVFLVGCMIVLAYILGYAYATQQRSQRVEQTPKQVATGAPIDFKALSPGRYKILQKFIDKTYGAYPDDIQLIVRRESDGAWLFVSKAPEEYLLSELAITFTVTARVSHETAPFFISFLLLPQRRLLLWFCAP